MDGIYQLYTSSPAILTELLIRLLKIKSISTIVWVLGEVFLFGRSNSQPGLKRDDSLSPSLRKKEIRIIDVGKA